MNKTSIDPSFLIGEIRTAIDTNDEIIFQSGVYNFGDDTIWVKGPKKISGVGAVIHGSAYRLMADFIPANANSNLSNMNFDPIACGIFSVVGPGLVEISGLTFEHNIVKPGQPVNDPNMPNSLGWHTSATIAHFVDNQVESSLIVEDCTFNTNATAAVDIWSINNAGPSPIMHEMVVRGCTLNAKMVTDASALKFGAGSYCGVVLGSFVTPDRPVDMRGGRFEVTDCNLDPQKFPAIALFNHVSDSESEFRICNNKIGCNSPQGGATSLGILLGLGAVYPKGTVLIMDNEINIDTYFQWGSPNDQSVGISATVNFDAAHPELRLETVISGNKINLGHGDSPKLGKLQDAWCVAGIYYEDKAGTGSAAIINDNEITSNGAAPPLWGICLHGASHDVVVKDNDLSGLAASHSQIFIDTNGNDCVLAENVLGELKPLPFSKELLKQGFVELKPGIVAFPPSPEAVLLCKGDNNWLLANDFGSCNVPGWKFKGAGGPGFIKLDASSDNNVFVSAGSLPRGQILDIGTNNHTWSH